MKFTVFTPTYNRGYILHRVYESLRGQTFRDFEWIVVDDGSKDNTRDMVERWKTEADFPIRYYWQENQGKHVAHNRAVELARGEYFIVLDSDDRCTENALERFDHLWKTTPPQSKDRFGMIWVLSKDPEGNIVGRPFPEEDHFSVGVEGFYSGKVVGEKFLSVKTEYLREYRFPELPGTRFIPEGVVWFPIARKYVSRFVNEALRIYYTDCPDQLMKTGKKEYIAYSAGLAWFHRDRINHDFQYFSQAKKEFLFEIIFYTKYSFHCGISPWDQYLGLAGTNQRILWLMSMPIGWLIYVRDRLLSWAK